LFKKVDDELRQEEKSYQKNIEERKQKKTQMFRQMKLIEDYIQNNQFQKMNYNQRHRDFDLHSLDHNLSDEIMNQFLRDF
jgi:hypothetical protein